ncbi:hypothetical protein L873DRAFT_1402217 [Choiromyces venosus 120613-1]|uniref:Uncharacterized protein n=1 Tax=Choiromyces venosus 120613-1 TaxID=1336337 RepID=A0A3N4J8Q5_9PEZI|nr:hypothetical protein L873DRAFT_1402217 [Choiromyces venosus 120613-1]
MHFVFQRSFLPILSICQLEASQSRKKIIQIIFTWYIFGKPTGRWFLVEPKWLVKRCFTLCHTQCNLIIPCRPVCPLNCSVVSDPLSLLLLPFSSFQSFYLFFFFFFFSFPCSAPCFRAKFQRKRSATIIGGGFGYSWERKHMLEREKKKTIYLAWQGENV